MGPAYARVSLAKACKPELAPIEFDALADAGPLHLCIPEHIAYLCIPEHIAIQLQLDE